MPLSVVGRAGPFRLMPHYVEWRLTGNESCRGRRGLMPGGRHLPPALSRWAGSLCAGMRAVCLSLHPTRSQGTG
ncbi:hypothetical protein [Photorhabdus thracensis]|uniref:hypothetical protein n=1 Tax=Photorhabdus thracensis TaxID=230089 RepID=UPI0013012849|nr:hypothetical protein [Photorhabdus thracensis]